MDWTALTPALQHQAKLYHQRADRNAAGNR
ncbi:hypothetical protein NP493_69g05024 [Ridgeia piscesae]|uniref:Uncharacterized protein n=1 Tax=Ridgeia piscesae TaxID=27915 RepID=A0AAD9UIP0_RIDPI|nr:hypothetical protein NP493_69g05024 [Ridgeia piscesae]